MKKQFIISSLVILLSPFIFINNTNAEIEINDENLYNSLKGKIILKVEANGEAYYVHPNNGKMYFLNRPNDAFQIIREQGIGITNTDLEKISEASNFCSANSTNCDISNISFVNEHKGKIFLQIENNGEAWYVNPYDSKRYFMGRPSDAFSLMRNLGLGISNSNFEKLIIAQELKNWSLYQNESIGFQINYPEKWIYADSNESNIFFGTPESRQGGYIWGINFYESKEKEKVIAQTGNQFEDRKEIRSEVKVNKNISATMVTVTTNKYPNWISKKIFFEINDNLFVIGNGAIDDDRFGTFYKSFRIIE